MKDRTCKRFCKILYLILISMILVSGCNSSKAEDLTELELEENSGDTTDIANNEQEDPDGDSPDAGDDQKEKDKVNTAFVYVCGAVNAPGVYELDSEARVYDAIISAGGMREDAAGEVLNQARMVTDGERIYVPTKEELEQGIVDGVAPEVTGTDSNTEGKININTAAKEDLKTLPGIGDAKADSIISYRESNGGFQKIEDLMQVEGIKEGVFNKIKDKIII